MQVVKEFDWIIHSLSIHQLCKIIFKIKSKDRQIWTDAFSIYIGVNVVLSLVLLLIITFQVWTF